MDPWELEARERVRETVARYAHRVDTGRFDDVGALFTDDGVLEVHGEAPMAGSAAIVAFLSGVGVDLAATSPVGLIRHHVSNLTIEFASAGEARAACYFLVVTENGLDHWGRYRDTLVPVGDQWLFAHRLVRTEGRTPGGWAAQRQHHKM